VILKILPFEILGLGRCFIYNLFSKIARISALLQMSRGVSPSIFCVDISASFFNKTSKHFLPSFMTARCKAVPLLVT
jgi:hypothetical protein